MSNFVKDFKNGKKGEQIFLDFLNKNSIIHEVNINKKLSELSKYDVKALDNTFEIKYDLYEAKSGNVAIEYYNPKSIKPSGVNITSAKFWVFILLDQTIWITTVAKLKDYIAVLDKNMGFVKDAIKCGDGNSSSYIYNKEIIFKNIFVRVDQMNKGDFVDVLNKLS